jgi:hypothetical protein
MQIFINYSKRMSQSDPIQKRLKPVAPIKRHFVLLGKFSFYNHSGVLNLCANRTRHFTIFQIGSTKLSSLEFNLSHMELGINHFR